LAESKFRPLIYLQGFGVHHALNPDPYRGAFGNDGPRYAEDVKDLIQTATSGRVAGFFAETIQVGKQGVYGLG
jgi:4-aminobutyrate aminotransferase-like enzyme